MIAPEGGPVWRMTSRSANVVLALLAVAAVSGCGDKRPPPPPADETYRLPWGAVPVESWDQKGRDEFQATLVRSIEARLGALRSANPGARLPYQVLALSGGGSRGAYGAGVLTGWTARGDRPEFEVVTGISTGALMATQAFLGSEFDERLTTYTRVGNDEIFRRRGKLEMLFSDSMLDSTPLRELLAATIDEETLELVAAQHRRGRRLFLGTTNLDANAFVVWEMGAIAASDRPDKLQRYRDVVLASASFPIKLPPVYIRVEHGGKTYYQMHVDGGARETVFFYDFVDEFGEALEELGLDDSDVHGEIYLLNNGSLYSRTAYTPVSGSVLGVTGATLTSLMRKVTLGSLYRLWVLALGTGADFHLSFIPPEFELSPDPLHFDPEEMQRLFDLGYERAIGREAWQSQEAPATREEFLALIDPRQKIDRLEKRPWLRDDVE
jgi:hypothetical protein